MSLLLTLVKSKHPLLEQSLLKESAIPMLRVVQRYSMIEECFEHLQLNKNCIIIAQYVSELSDKLRQTMLGLEANVAGLTINE